MSKNKNMNNDDSSYLIMVNTTSNNISIKVNNDKAKKLSIKQTTIDLSFSISDFKQLLKDHFGITNDEADFYCSFYEVVHIEDSSPSKEIVNYLI